MIAEAHASWRRRCGLLAEDGLLTGVGESAEDLADSILDMAREPLDQVRAMSYVPHESTFPSTAGDTLEERRAHELLAIAAMRLVMEDRLIPASGCGWPRRFGDAAQGWGERGDVHRAFRLRPCGCGLQRPRYRESAQERCRCRQTAWGTRARTRLARRSRVGRAAGGGEKSGKRTFWGEGRRKIARRRFKGWCCGNDVCVSRDDPKSEANREQEWGVIPGTESFLRAVVECG